MSSIVKHLEHFNDIWVVLHGGKGYHLTEYFKFIDEMPADSWVIALLHFFDGSQLRRGPGANLVDV